MWLRAMLGGQLAEGEDGEVSKQVDLKASSAGALTGNCLQRQCPLSPPPMDSQWVALSHWKPLV